MRRVIFLILLGVIFTAVIIRAHFQIIEGASGSSVVPEWAKDELKAKLPCPAIVSQCLLPDMISDLTKKIQQQQDLIAQYTKEITDIENRYPITFRINAVDVSNGYLEKIRQSSMGTPLDFSAWVSGSLPYPQLSFTFPESPMGPQGNPGPLGAQGLATDSTTVMPLGFQGPPGYFGKAK